MVWCFALVLKARGFCLEHFGPVRERQLLTLELAISAVDRLPSRGRVLDGLRSVRKLRSISGSCIVNKFKARIPPVRAADLIREARLRAGLTQDELAGRSGMQRSVIARWEQGAVQPGFDNML